MRKLAVVTFAAFLLGGCAAVPTAPTADTRPKPVALLVSGFLTLDHRGHQERLQALVLYDDGTALDRSNEASWLSSNPTVARVEAGGIVTAMSDGRCTIAATYESVSGTKTVVVDIVN